MTVVLKLFSWGRGHGPCNFIFFFVFCHICILNFYKFFVFCDICILICIPRFPCSQLSCFKIRGKCSFYFWRPRVLYFYFYFPNLKNLYFYLLFYDFKYTYLQKSRRLKIRENSPLFIVKVAMRIGTIE